MDIDDIRSGVGERVNQPVGILHHQVDVKDKACQRAQPLDYRWPERQVRDKNPVHHVKMEHVGARLLDEFDFVRKAGKNRMLKLRVIPSYNPPKILRAELSVLVCLF